MVFKHISTMDIFFQKKSTEEVHYGNRINTEVQYLGRIRRESGASTKPQQRFWNSFVKAFLFTCQDFKPQPSMLEASSEIAKVYNQIYMLTFIYGSIWLFRPYKYRPFVAPSDPCLKLITITVPQGASKVRTKRKQLVLWCPS